MKFQNYQLRSNVNINLTNSTELIVRLSGNFSEYNGPITTDGSFASDLYNIAMHTSPVLFPAYYEPDAANANTQHILFGNVGIGSAGLSSNSIQYNNPYAALLRGHKNSSESRMSAQFEVNQNFDFITKGLKFRGIFNTNRYSFLLRRMPTLLFIIILVLITKIPTSILWYGLIRNQQATMWLPNISLIPAATPTSAPLFIYRGIGI
ncbi:hypothetical protein LWM68_14230 [Niabella sp. W65]|nr:hypothetical protein [Niabella sp. W65]MCH7363804.1 hypothetical protein [Niabella sp. W65]ULT39708.1 hypothetical protein KRR40_33050 [Niabella sp. I65]